MGQNSRLSQEWNNLFKNHVPLFQSPKMQFALVNLPRQSKTVHKSSRSTFKGQVSTSPRKETFRSFVKQKRSYVQSKERLNFVHLNEEMKSIIETIDGNFSNLKLSQINELKQKVMSVFLNNIIDDLSKQNVDKAQLLVTIWKNLFLLVQKSVEKIIKNSKDLQKQNLAQQVGTHIKYQGVLGECLKQKKDLQEESIKKQKFMKILVAKIRQYKKQIKKNQQNLRMAAQKLNQFRNGFLQVQIQCINLTMELRNLGEESAKMMVNKKMALTLEKSKQYKILPSKKKLKKQIKAEGIISDSPQNVQYKNQFYEVYKGCQTQKPENIPKSVSRQIQAILDGDESEAINYAIFNENLVQNKYMQKQVACDKQTDMQGFFIDKADKKVGINPQQRFYLQQTRMRGVQTQAIQKIIIKTGQFGTQCDFKMLLSSKLVRKKTLDLSFLFQNTPKSLSMKARQNFVAFKSIKQITNEKKPLKNPKKVAEKVNDLAISNSNEQTFSNDKSESSININEGLSQKKSQPIQQNQQGERSQSFFPVEWVMRKRTRKLGSAVTNKVSFLHNVSEYIKKSQKQQDSIKIIQSLDEAQHKQILMKNKSSNISINDSEFNISSKQNIQMNNNRSFEMQNDLRQKNKTKNFSSLHRNGKKIQEENKIGNNKNLSKTHWNDSEDQAGRQRRTTQPKTEKSIPQNSSQIKKDLKINIQQFYQDIETEIKKTKGSVAGFKNLNKLKEMIKTIQLSFQFAYREQQNSGKFKPMSYYLYEAVSTQYGLTNSSYLKKKVVVLMKQLFLHHKQSIILTLFLMMMRITQDGTQSHQSSEQNNSVILKLIKALSSNWKLPIKIEDLKIIQISIPELLQNQLTNYGFSKTFILSMIKYVQQSNSIIINGKNQQLFQIIVAINKYLIKRQSIIISSYDPILTILCGDSSQISIQFLELITELQFFSNNQKKTTKNYLNQFFSEKSGQKGLKRADFAYFCCQKQIYDFPRLLYKGLNLFELKQNEQFLKSITVQKLKQLKMQWMSKQLRQKIFKQCDLINDSNAFFHAVVKKNLLILLYLKQKQYQCQSFVQQILGQSLIQLTNF